MDSLPEIQVALDRHVLQYMAEMHNSVFPRDGYAFHLSCFVALPWITKDMARAVCRSLTDRGFAFYMRGLFTEDGDPAGAGYGITDAGIAYPASIIGDAS